MVYLGYWFMFPVSILVATLAMTFGVGGAVLFSPIFIVVFPLLGVPTLSPATAFASSLLIMLVGFGSGLVGYQCRGLIDYRTGADFLALTAPMAIVGAVVQSWLAGPALLLLFAAMMGFLAVLVFVRRQPRPTSSQPPCCMHEMTSTSAGSAAPAGVAQQAAAPSQDVEAVNPAGTGALDSTQDMLRDPTRLPSTSVSSVASGSGLGRGCVWRYFNASSPRQLVDSKGITHSYVVRHPPAAVGLVSLGAFVTGLASVGVGETTVSTLRVMCHLPMRVAAATSVFVVAVTIAAASVTNVIISGVGSVPWTLVMFAAPGVLIGGQIGPHVSSKVPSWAAERALVALFGVLGVTMAGMGIDKAIDAWG